MFSMSRWVLSNADCCHKNTQSRLRFLILHSKRFLWLVAQATCRRTLMVFTATLFAAKHLRQFELDDFFQLVPKERIVPHIQVAVDKATIEHRSEVLKPVHTADSTVTDTEEPTTFWDVQGAPVEGLETGETYETHIDDDDWPSLCDYWASRLLNRFAHTEIIIIVFFTWRNLRH